MWVPGRYAWFKHTFIIKCCLLRRSRHSLLRVKLYIEVIQLYTTMCTHISCLQNFTQMLFLHIIAPALYTSCYWYLGSTNVYGTDGWIVSLSYRQNYVTKDNFSLTMLSWTIKVFYIYIIHYIQIVQLYIDGHHTCRPPLSLLRSHSVSFHWAAPWNSREWRPFAMCSTKVWWQDGVKRLHGKYYSCCCHRDKTRR